MSITLDTKLKILKDNKEILSSFNDIIIFCKENDESYYGYFTERKQLLEEHIKKDKNFEELFRILNGLYTFENKKNNEKKYELIINFLNVIKKYGIDFIEVINNTLKKDKSNKDGWLYDAFIDLYVHYLEINNKKISSQVFDEIISGIECSKRTSSFANTNENIKNLFLLLNVSEKKKYDEFIKLLDKVIKEEDDNVAFFDFDSQKAIYDYIYKNFKDKLNYNVKYYKDYDDEDYFNIKSAYQSTINVNIFKFLKELNLTQNNLEHLKHIAQRCIDVVCDKNFLNLINEKMEIFNIIKAQNQNGIVISFSANNIEDLKKIERIYQLSLSGIMQDHKNIYFNWHENYSGEDTLHTNMDEKRVAKYYLHQKLNSDLVLNNNVNEKTNKI